MSLTKGKGRVDAAVAKRSTKSGNTAKSQKPLLKLEPLPPPSALSGMSAAERTERHKHLKHNRESAEAHFAARGAKSLLGVLPPGIKQRRGGAEGVGHDAGDDEHISVEGKSENDDDEDDDEDDDDDDDDDDEEILLDEAAFTAKRLKRSSLQHGYDRTPMLCKLPEWVAITDDFLERAVLGTVDFMLGLNKSSKRLNAGGRFLHLDPEGEYWYVVTREQLAVWLRIKKPSQIRYAVGRLVKKGFLCSTPHTRGGKRNAVAMRLRVNWPVVEAAYDSWSAHWDDVAVG